MYSSRSKVVSITTAVSVSARIRSAAWRPSSSGMRMSISTTSGLRRVTTSTAARPSAASPTTVDAGLGVEDHAEARAQKALTVSDDDADLARRLLGDRALRFVPAHLGGGHAFGHARQPHGPGG